MQLIIIISIITKLFVKFIGNGMILSWHFKSYIK